MTRKEFDALLEPEVSDLSFEMAIIYHRYAVIPFQVPRLVVHSLQPTFVLAKAENEAVYYDDIEKEFGTGTLIDGAIQNGGTWGERLEWALRHFPEKQPLGGS